MSVLTQPILTSSPEPGHTASQIIGLQELQDIVAVDLEDLHFNGIDGLRVVDNSIMPTVISSNTNAAAIMIGEKCADMIKAKHGM